MDGWLWAWGSLHEAVAGTTDDQCSVTDEVDASDGVGVRGEGAHHPRSSHVPEEDGFVVGAADEHVAFRRECEGVDVVVVAEERDGVWFALLRSACAVLPAKRDPFSPSRYPRAESTCRRSLRPGFSSPDSRLWWKYRPCALPGCAIAFH